LTGGSVNVALGGARADGAPNALGPIPGVPSQIAIYEGYSALSGQTPFKPTDLVTLLAGPNDIFQGFAAAAAMPNPQLGLQTLGTTTAGSVVSDVGQLITGGAKTILLSNLPNLGGTPSADTPLKQQGGLLVTLAFNQALNSGAQGLAGARPDVNIVQMDLFSLNQVVVGNPTAFGLTNITDQCVLSAACAASGGKGYAFWDGEHPTAQVHQLIARYAALLLSTEQTGAAVDALGQFALSSRLEASDIIFRRGLAPIGKPPGGLYAEVIGQTGSFDGANFPTYGNTGFDYALGGARVGFDASDGSIVFGSSFAFQTGSLSGRALSSDLRATQIDAYALSHFSSFFAGLEAGVSLNEFNDLRRATGFPTVTAEGGTQSVDYTVAGTVGAQYQLDGVTLTPAARIGYASLNINGFTESAPILALSYGDRDVTTGFWTGRLRAAMPFVGGPGAIAYGEVGYEGLFATSDGYSAKLASNTAHAVTIDDNLEARGFFLKAGVGGNLTNNIKLSGEYGLSLQNGSGDIHSGRLRLTIPLSGDLPLGE
jgi:outer membrane lipase/esterase